MWRVTILGLSLISGIILIIQNWLYLQTSAELLLERNLVKDNIQYSLEIADVIHSMQNERDIMSLYESVGGDPFVEELLLEAELSTDGALNRLSRWVSSVSPRHFRQKDVFRRSLAVFRNQTDRLTYQEVTRYYSSEIGVFIEWMVNAVKEEKNSNIWAELVAYHMLINWKECVGIELSLGTYFYTHGTMDLETLLWYKGRHDTGDRFQETFESYSALASILRRKYIDIDLETRMYNMRWKIINNTQSTVVYSFKQGMFWIENMTSYIDQLNDLTRAMADHIAMKTEEEIRGYKLDVFIDISVLVVTCIVNVLVAIMTYKISKGIEFVKRCLQEKTGHLEKEQERTESLLSQLVPSKISRRMRTSSVQSELFESVTVMNADISNLAMFIKMSTPAELLVLINDVFDVFEKRLEKHNVSKLGTTGSTLMVASGLHQKHTRRHAEEIANLALDLRDRIHNILVQHALDEKIKLKIGICTGSVTAGVIDGKLPRYCLFGETVIDAQLLADTCLPLQIQIAESTYMNLANITDYIMRERDDITTTMNGSVRKRRYWLCGSMNTALMQIELNMHNNEVDV